MRIFVIFSAFALALAACSSPNDTQAATGAIPVHVVEVAEEDVPVYIESLGTLKPAATVEVRPQVSGLLLQIHFKEGELVKKGDLLFTIDPVPYAIKLKEAEAQLASDQARVEVLRKKMERYHSLKQKDIIAPMEWDDLEAELAQAEASVQGDEANLASAQYELQHCSLAAPMQGRAGKLGYHVGNAVSPTQESPLVTLMQCDELSVEFNLTEKEHAKLHLQKEIAILVRPIADPVQGEKGILAFYDNAFDPTSGLILATGIISNEAGRLLPGQGVTVQVPVTVLKNVISIPVKAVKINQKGPYAFVISPENKAIVRQLQLGAEKRGSVVVVEGLQKGERIVTDGHLRLSPDALVEIVQGEL